MSRKESIERNLSRLMMIKSKNSRFYLLNDKWVSSCSLGRELNKIGLTIQEWYDTNILEISSPDERPKCPICGKECRFISIPGGYSLTCKNKECVNKLHGIHFSNFYKDKDKVKEKVNSWRKVMTYERLSEIQCSIRDKDPLAYSKMKSEANKLAVKNNPDLKSKRSKYKKEWWSNQENHDNMVDTLKNKYKEDPSYSEKKSRSLKITLSTDEMKMKLSESQRKKWENPTEKMLNPNYKNGNALGLNYSGIKSRMYSPYEDKEIIFDSNWERIWFINSTNNPDIINIKRCPISIKYLNPNDNKYHSYIPDFLIEYSNGYKEVIEIKPLCRFYDNIVKLKSKEATKFLKSQGIEYRIITEENYKFTSLMED